MIIFTRYECNIFEKMYVPAKLLSFERTFFRFSLFSWGFLKKPPFSMTTFQLEWYCRTRILNFRKILNSRKKKIHVYSPTIKINSNLEILKLLPFSNLFVGKTPDRFCPNRFARPTGMSSPRSFPVYGTSKRGLFRTVNEILIWFLGKIIIFVILATIWAKNDAMSPKFRQQYFATYITMSPALQCRPQKWRFFTFSMRKKFGNIVHWFDYRYVLSWIHFGGSRK